MHRPTTTLTFLFILIAATSLLTTSCLTFDPDAYYYECESNSDCVEGYFCSVNGQFDVKVCAPICDVGFADCDKNIEGCETPLGTQSDCGGCFDSCGDGSLCQIDGSSSQFVCQSCDRDRAFCGEGVGCIDLEINPDHCGQCGNSCGDNTSCQEGECLCEEGFADCNPDDGVLICESLNSARHCGQCGNSCEGDNLACTVGVCDCTTGFENCDFDLANGCEADLTSDNTCGACLNDCTLLDNMSCSDQTCACSDNFEDCDDDRTLEIKTGCETPLNENDSCGACGVSCSAPDICINQDFSWTCDCPSGPNWFICGELCSDVETDPMHCGACDNPCNANEACVEGMCQCDENFGDCDATITGCETSLSSDIAHCGGCDAACEITNVTMTSCENNECLPTCEENFDDCDGNGHNGCETDLSIAREHCSQCGNPCSGDLVCSAGVCVEPIVEISIGYDHACARRASGEVYCWGENDKGQIGDGTQNSASLTVLITSLGAAQSISAGYKHTCAILDNGNVLCWGQNDAKQTSGCLGGTCNNNPILNPYSIPALADMSKIAVDASQKLKTRSSFPPGGPDEIEEIPTGYSCSLSNSGHIECWGNPYWNALDIAGRVPTMIGTISDFVDVGTGYTYACAIHSDTSVRCWGSNLYGELGFQAFDIHDGSEILGISSPSSSYAKPVMAIKGASTRPLSDVSFLSVGSHHACLLRQASSTIYCWGKNDSGQLGAPSPTEPSAVAVSLPSEATSPISIAAGGSHTCALTDENKVYCWGDNSKKQMGLGHNGPGGGEVPGLTDITYIAAGHDQTCAINGTTGHVHCWGDGDDIHVVSMP